MPQQEQRRNIADLMAKAYNWLYEYWQKNKTWFAFQPLTEDEDAQCIFPEKGWGNPSGFYCNLVKLNIKCCVQLRFGVVDFKEINKISFYCCYTNNGQVVDFYKHLSDELKEGKNYIKVKFQPGINDEEIKKELFRLLDRAAEKFKNIDPARKIEMPRDGERHEKIAKLIEEGLLIEENGGLSVPPDAQFSGDGTDNETDANANGDASIGQEEMKERNLIRFGAPGTGKSFAINEEYKKDWWSSKERVTFHPDYSYANFVGAYKPYMKGKKEITYAFVPGPFTRVLVNALRDPNGKHLLVIEEINRANTAAVFGDIFQLLDRGKNGESEYAISPSQDLAKFLRDALKQPKTNDDDWWWLTTEPLDEKEVEGKIRELKIPSNMYLWATMNSADQGVFPMDTAFKRRWSFEYVGIDDGNLKGNLAELWNVLRKAINDELIKLKVNEDKCMGPFFLAEGDLKDVGTFLRVFKSKVLMYLFEDAARQKRSNVFADGLNTLSSIFNAVEGKFKKAEDKKGTVFKDEELEKALGKFLEPKNGDKNKPAADEKSEVIDGAAE